jgi:hypothetical protein
LLQVGKYMAIEISIQWKILRAMKRNARGVMNEELMPQVAAKRAIFSDGP